MSAEDDYKKIIEQGRKLHDEKKYDEATVTEKRGVKHVKTYRRETPLLPLFADQP